MVDLYLLVDVLELGIPIRVRRTLAGFAVALQAVTQVLEQFRHHAMAHLVALAVEFRRQLAHTLADPAQGRLWVTTTERFNQLLQIAAQGRIFNDRPLATTARLADLFDAGGGGSVQFLQTDPDGTTRDTGRTRHGRYAAIAQRFSLSRGIEPPQPLVQKGLEAGKALLDKVYVHTRQCTTNRPRTQLDMVIS